MKQVVYKKLVRDRIPDIIAADGRRAKTRVLGEHEYVSELKRKLAEEVEEFQASGDAGELADIMEVVYALAVHLGVNPPELEKMRQAKRDERGGFDRKIFLIESEINEEKGD
ncbi:MAG: nucleoside triphosphate pyrophosphohydrolase [Candidatus Poribacteria bacterium]